MLYWVAMELEFGSLIEMVDHFKRIFKCTTPELGAGLKLQNKLDHIGKFYFTEPLSYLNQY